MEFEIKKDVKSNNIQSVIENYDEPEIEKTVQDVQQQFANNIGYHGAVVWDRFAENDKNALATKLELLFPTIEVSDFKSQKQLVLVNKENHETLKQRKHLLDKIWAQRVYCGGNLKMAIIFVLCTSTVAKNKPISAAKYSTTYSTHPVFRIWKCSVHGESKDCCKIFIDETGTVYKNWLDFIKNNTYSEGILIAPKDGVYDVDENNEVILEFKLTPTAKPLNKTVKKPDARAAIFGVLGVALPAFAMFTPLAPLAPAMGPVAVGAASTAFSMGKSIANFVDRGQHKQAFNLKNSKTRQNWLNIFGGAISLGANGALVGASKHLAKENALPKIVDTTVKGVNIASMAVNGVGLGNSIVDVIRKGKNNDISSSEILQLSTSLCLFTHSIYNYQLATKIVDNSHGNADEIQNNLISEQKDILTELVNNTLLLQGNAAPKCIDLVRSLGKIPDITSGLIELGATIESGRAGEWKKMITKKFFVANEDALNNCLYIIGQKLQGESFDFMVSNTENFFKDILSDNKIECKPLIPFEHVLWDIFDMSNKFSKDEEITKEFLTSNMNEILSQVKNHYCDNIYEDTEEVIKCKYCDGYYQKTKLSN